MDITAMYVNAEDFTQAETGYGGLLRFFHSYEADPFNFRMN